MSQRKASKQIALALSGLLAILSGISAWAFIDHARTFKRNEMAKGPQVGLPRTHKELRREVSAEKNARPLLDQFEAEYQKARNTLLGQELAEARRNLPTTRQRYSELLSKFVASNTRLTQLSDRIRAKTELVTYTLPQPGSQPKLLNFRPSWNLIRFSVQRATVLRNQGKPNAAMRVLCEAAPIAGLVRQDPTYLGNTMSISFERAILQAAMTILEEHGASPSVRDQALQLLKEFHEPADYRASIRYEYATLLAFESMLKANPNEAIDQFFRMRESPNNPQLVYVKLLLSTPGLQEDILAFPLSQLRQAFETLPPDPNQAQERIQLTKKLEVGQLNLLSRYTVLSDLLSPVRSGPYEIAANQIAERRAFEAIVACLAHKERFGSYPKQLPVAGEKALDPFSEKPLKYIATPTSVKIYSVGRDAVDHGGNFTATDRNRRDIGYGLPIQRWTPRRANEQAALSQQVQANK
jgi:hypothetical protein